MKTHKMKLAGWVFTFFALLLLPTTSHAYFTTEQNAIQITENTVLYSVTYKFGHKDRGMYMPIAATRGAGITTEGLEITYAIISTDDEPVTAGTSNGLILTNNKAVEIRDNQYYVRPGHAASFTLLAFLTVEPETIINTPLSLLVTDLPFTMTLSDGCNVKNQLNPSELTYYRTPAVTLE